MEGCHNTHPALPCLPSPPHSSTLWIVPLDATRCQTKDTSGMGFGKGEGRRGNDKSFVRKKLLH